MRWTTALRASPAALFGALWTLGAEALTVSISERSPSLAGAPATFEIEVADAVGTVEVRWDTGDESRTDFVAGLTRHTHTYAAPGHYPVLVTVRDDQGFSGLAFVHTVHRPLTPARARWSSELLYDEARDRLFVANEDNHTLSVVDAVGLTKVAEAPVLAGPVALAWSPHDRLWVLHREAHAILVVEPETLAVERELALPRASQPIGLVMSPAGDAAYVSLMALGKVLKLDPESGAVIGEAEVGPTPRGIAVSHDGEQIYVTRFISDDTQGEVVQLDADLGVSRRIQLAADTTTLDTDQQGRGLPNYLFSVAISPDGVGGWVPGKKDNVFRGLFRDQQALSADNTVRPMVAILDLAEGAERLERRIDLDDRNLPTQVEFTALGDYAFVSVAGSGLVEVRDAYSGGFVTALSGAGFAPRGLSLTRDHKLFVHASASRTLVAYDVADIVASADFTTRRIAEIALVEHERLDPLVLRGKQIFFDASDLRMSGQGYLSCASCHFEGGEDGRVWDFASMGEGLRNTVSLLGRRGTGHGNVNWSGNFDEIQDIDGSIRHLFGGTGFLDGEAIAKGADAPLGEPKAGLSEELDALAAYVASLTTHPPSPHRNPDGTLTEDAVEGRKLFRRLGCGFCHGGPDATDSAQGKLHDVGTLEPTSGSRLGDELTGLDTPTLHGAWATPPYLHDGSAKTLRDVLVAENPDDRHGYVSVLSDVELDRLVSYLEQLDGTPDPEPPEETGAEPGGGETSGGEPRAMHAGGGGFGCAVAGGTPAGNEAAVLVACWALVALGRRRRRAPNKAFGTSRRALVAALLLAGCGGDDPTPAGPWDDLPEVQHVAPELAGLPRREEQYRRLCALDRGDSFFRALCSTPRPEPGDLAGLIRLSGLSRDRAFALTGNSTSLVMRAVSAVNPRMIVFPRVDETRAAPDELTVLGFVRGEPFVEIVSRDLESGDYNFYLFTFERSCDYVEGGCDLASLLSEEIEHGWTAFSVYTEEDLENTPLDCRSCHQPEGYGTRKILRMQELEAPWLHWFPQRFVQRTDSDRLLTAQFLEAHRFDAQYGGIPISTIEHAVDEGSGAQLEALLVAEGQAGQPNAFDPRIEAEAKAGEESASWQRQFEVFLTGDAIAVPYPLADVTDAALRAEAVRSYLDVVTGAAPRESLRDLRDLFSDDARLKLGLVPPPGADGRTVLKVACARCHDGRGNPGLSRNAFDVKRLDELPRAIKHRAIARLREPETSPRKMPPARAATLSPEAIEAAIAALSE